MYSNILDAVTEHYNTLTRSGKKLADYILANKANVQYMSITSLAESSNVSEATITRFCKELGVAGYNDFKLALAKASGTHATSLIDNNLKISADDDSIIQLCKRLFALDVTALRETLNLIDPDQAEKAIDLICNARHIYCFGQGGSNVTAKEAWARFSTATSSFIHIEDSHMQAMAASLCSSSDVILFFSYSGSTKDMQDVLLPAKNAGASIILITHFSNSPAVNFADVVLLCGSKESPLQSGSVAAKIGQLFIIDYLFYGYCKRCEKYSHLNLETTAAAITSKLL